MAVSTLKIITEIIYEMNGLLERVSKY